MIITKSKLVAGIVALTMVLSLVGATSASALTAQEMLQLLIAAGVIAPDKAAAATAALNAVSAPASSSYTFAKDLTVGSRGADVTALQNLLGVSPATGYFGSLTKAAVIQYQLSKGITPPAGYVGPKTRAVLNASVTTTTTTTTIPSGTDLSVTLAATSPAAGSIVAGQAAANLAEYTFRNNSAAPAVVTNVTLQRLGVSADTTLSNVYLFEGAVRLTDSATVSSGKISFNSGAGLFTVAPGTSKTISVRSNILTGTSGQLVAVALSGVTAGNVAVSASYPIAGASMNIFTASDISTVTLASTSVSTSVQAGTLGQTIWGSSFSLSGKAVYLRSLAVKVIGSVPADSLQNIKLFVSGIQVASASGIDANGMITFDLTSAPYKIDSNRSLEIRADVVNGSNRTFSVSMQNVADISIIDSNYNVGIAALGTLPTTNTITISAGTLSMSLDTTLSAGNVVYGSTGVTLARYTAKAFGENMKVSYLNVASTQDLTNVAIYANGASISSTQNVASTSATLFSLGSSLIINAGQTTTLEVRGDLKNSAGTSIATSSTVYVTLSSYTNNTQGSYSSALTSYPTTALVGPTMTVVGGTLTVSKNAGYSNQTLTANTNAVKVGSFILSSNSSEAVRVTSVKVGLSGTMPTTALSNLRISESSQTVTPQASTTFGTDFTIAANGSKTVDVYADVGAIASVANAADTQTLVTATSTPSSAGRAATGTVTFTTGYLDIGDTVSVNVQGQNFTYTSSVASTTATTSIAALVTYINAGSSYVTAATTTNDLILLTAITAGTAANSYTLVASESGHLGTVSANNATLVGGIAPVAQIASVTPANVEVGDVFTVTVAGTSVSYTAAAATVADVTAGLTAAINANATVAALVTAVDATTAVTVTSDTTNSATAIISAATNGTHSTTNTLAAALEVVAAGVTSNVDASSGVVGGQTLTVGSGTLGAPTRVATSPSARYVLGGTTGSSIATFNFKATVGAATIKELSFVMNPAASPAITSITVGGVTKSVALSATTTVSGLNINVPVTNAGTDVPVTVAYNTVGNNGIPSNVSAILKLGTVKYQSGNTETTSNVSVSSNAMYPVAGVPTIDIVDSSSALANGSTEIARVAFTVSGSPVRIREIPIKLSYGATATTTAVQIYDGSTEVGSTTAAMNADGTGTIVLNDGGFVLSSSKTFRLLATITGATAGVGTDAVTTQLGAAASFLWDDVEGDVTTGVGTYIPSYSTTDTSFISN
ncbi:MAG: peptidoglycan-binding domain-containing protein [Candidatus Paceibacterota bacterium]|jgi:hypothetical protein